MAVTVPIPEDDTYDYIPIDGSKIEVGMDILACWTVQGELTHVFPPTTPEDEELWVYFAITDNPDLTTTVGTMLYPETPSLRPDHWWLRYAMWRRTAKLRDGGIVTAPDGSKWIYPVGEDGRMRCYASGSLHVQGDKRFRGELTTDPRDLWICDDPDRDWLPVTDGSQVGVGDTVSFLMASNAVVQGINVVDSEYSRVLSFVGANSIEIGWWYEEIYDVRRRRPRPPPTRTVIQANIWSWFQRLPKPPVDTRFSAPDGSRWIFTGGIYYCWGSGTQYRAGAVFRRGGIEGRLTQI